VFRAELGEGSHPRVVSVPVAYVQRLHAWYLASRDDAQRAQADAELVGQVQRQTDEPARADEGVGKRNHQEGHEAASRLNYAIVLPSGSGKSTLASKHEFLVDIDTLHSNEFRSEMEQHYAQARKTGDWKTYNTIECNWILPQLQPFTMHHVLLVHCTEKAQLLGLTVLGVWKTSRATMEKVVEMRGDTQGITMHNWESLQDAQILDTHHEIEHAVLQSVDSMHKEQNNVLKLK